MSNITKKFENEIKQTDDVNINSSLDYLNMLNKLIIDSNISISKIGTETGMGNYIYQILDGRKHPSRNHILKILIFIKCDLKTSEQILQGFGYSKIYVRIKRDAIIYKGLLNKKSLYDIECELFDNNLESL